MEDDRELAWSKFDRRSGGLCAGAREDDDGLAVKAPSKLQQHSEDHVPTKANAASPMQI